MTLRLVSTPRFNDYPDLGCWFAPACLSCPRPLCILDEPRATQKMLAAARWQRVREALDAGLSIADAAEHAGVSERTVTRVKAKGRANHAV